MTAEQFLKLAKSEQDPQWREVLLMTADSIEDEEEDEEVEDEN